MKILFIRSFFVSFLNVCFFIFHLYASNEESYTTITNTKDFAMITPFTSEILNSLSHVNHGFFTRSGGVSDGNFKSLNCKGPRKGEINDFDNNVQENREHVVVFLGGDTWIGLEQQHTNIVHFVEEPWQNKAPIGDGLVTTTKGLVLSILTADCVPILLSDRVKPVIAAIHAGWQGAFNGVIENTLAMMSEKGATDIVAAIGPCIQQDNYEVGHEFKNYFNNHLTLSKTSEFNAFFKDSPKKDHFLFDLPGLIRHILQQNGVKNIENLALDTYSNEERFFSYRRRTHKNEAANGCQASCIVLED